ncbi:hypothetical protein ACFY7C_07400 [Streptomyces sp. NPDC012769]|uniref:hypothetical protein n=1 Tax=Streptomyces sp. NPDC012769 TaxID=3364848 RepID=UPI0036B5CC8B
MLPALERLVVQRTLRIPAPSGPSGQGAAATRQFDVALMSVGFKLSAGLLAELSGRAEETVVATATRTLDAVRELVGAHVRHNPYFARFPVGVPDTADFWTDCVAQALSADDATRARTLAQLRAGSVNLLTLPTYGRYQHTYEEMAAAHDELIASAGDRVTVLHLGAPLDEEVTALYLALAGSVTPLGPEALSDLAVLAEHRADGPQPEAIPVRESRAVVNRARLRAGRGLLLDTVTDVLRLACALSDGDVTLRQRTRFRTPSRPHRRALLAGLDAVVAAHPAKLADVAAHREAWKRLGERLHPHEYPQWPHAAEVFAVARGERKAPTLAGRAEELLRRGEVGGAAGLLAAAAPGLLIRSLDRLLRTAGDDKELEAVLAAAERAAPRVSGRVVLSLREHLQNRTAQAERQDAELPRDADLPEDAEPDAAGARQDAPRRVFVNPRGKAWIADDTRAPLPPAVRDRLVALLDAEIRRRLPVPDRLLVDPDVLDVALPLSGWASAAGFGTLPRGSVSPVEGELLRFFTYWKQARRETDHDLSALILDDAYDTLHWLSYTNLSTVGGTHSGDVTEAPHGASEFIDVRLAELPGSFVVPQVIVYQGEAFDEVKESFFGFMLRSADQQGRPYEPRTVRMKSELRGPGRVAMPLVFQRDDEGRWQARWLHLHIKTGPLQYRAEDNRVTVAALVRDLVARTPLTLRYLIDLMTEGGSRTTLWDGRTLPRGPEPVTSIGLERPDGLAPGSCVITPQNLRDVIPA